MSFNVFFIYFQDEFATGMDSTEDELDSGIMDDDLPVELRNKRKRVSVCKIPPKLPP